MRDDLSFVFSVEHASKNVPKGFSYLLSGEEHTLFDRGAKRYATDLATVCNGKLFLGNFSRRLVDLNRSRPKQPKFIIDRYYTPFRKRVFDYVENEIAQGKKVVHISCHTFTGTFFGVERHFDLGILYDPRRRVEKETALLIQQKLKKSTSVRVRLNQPYRGTSDGHTTALRKKFPVESFCGIELEVNQKLFEKKQHPLWKHVWFPELVEALLIIKESVYR
jgi:predicted N-formylglutamate amidohydrolase